MHIIDPTNDAMQHSQSSATAQLHHQQTLTFSENLNHEQLALWLDIGKLKGNTILHIV